jgi:RHS repeat-associated protein
VLQDIQYQFDDVGNVSSYENKAGTYTTAQEYAYDGLYQLVYAKGVSVNKPHGDFDYQAEYTQTYQFDAQGLGNMTQKRSWTANTDPRRLGDPLDYEQDYAYAAGYAHRAERIGRRHYRYDLNGNVATEQDGPFSTVVSTGGHTITELENGTKVVDNGWGMNDNGVTIPAPKVWKREYAWNERNLLRTSRDDQHIVEYTYGQDGERSGKYSMTADGGHRHETLYFNKMWTWHYDGLLNEFTGQNSKHVYLGESRIVTKISRADNGGFTAEERIKQYYYHSDHLGSAQVISNADGQEYERIEYTPYGELWIEKASTASNIDIPYRFTGKERDEETGLYYYGARYLDSKASRWLSTDPALGDYIPGAPVDDEARKRNQNLPGMGGVFNLINLHLYHYAGNNPVKYIDPDGRKIRYAEGVSEEFKNDFAKIIQYLNKSETSWYVAQLEKRPEIIYLDEGKDLDDFYFDPADNKIVMNSRSGLKIEEGKTQSPALGFLHEVMHALQKLENPEQFETDIGANTNDDYDTVEEKRVIEKYETPAAKRMEEPIRTNHRGTSILVPDPTYSENK